MKRRTEPGLLPRPRLRARWRVVVRGISRGLDRRTIAREVLLEGGLSARYVIMCALSAGIATLGLMLSSPAVVIGAMLLSPLMGPIILLGFAFWTVNWPATRRAIVGLAVGIGIGLLVAVALTALLPLKTPTAEILARTRPNLVDLLIAIFSGVAGAYAVIHRRGETAIGVAIATAIMPPIATVGFGLGIGEWAISTGALLLFATNLVAIAIAAALMAGLYGFRGERDKAARGWVRHAAVLLVLAMLCVPLTVSLRTIALESQANAAVRTQAREVFGAKSRLASLKVRSADRSVFVDGLIITPAYVSAGVERLRQRLAGLLHARVEVRLDQVVMANPADFAARREKPTAEAPDLAQSVRSATPFPLDGVSVDAEQGAIIAFLSPASGLDLRGAMALEQGLRGRTGLSGTELIPPVQVLDPLPATIDHGAADLGPDLAVQRWALARWRAGAVRAAVCGAARGSAAAAGVADALGKAFAPVKVQVERSGSGCNVRPPARGFVLLTPLQPPPAAPGPAAVDSGAVPAAPG